MNSIALRSREPVRPPHSARRRRPAIRALALGLAWLACGRGEPVAPVAVPLAEAESENGLREAPPPLPGVSRDARLDTYELLRADAAAPRHPADGGGRAWLDMDSPPHPRAATPTALEIVFEVGPEGIAVGGLVFLQPSPFWDWDPPQVGVPEAPGYTTVETDAEGVELGLDDGSGAFLAVEIGGRALRPGERIRFVYGAGEVGAHVDRFAEQASPIYLAVDGDGDGVRVVIDTLPRIDIAPHPPRRLHVAAGSTAEPGEPVRVVIGALDALGNAARIDAGGVRFVDPPAGADLPEAVDLSGDPGAHRTLVVRGLPAGVHRLAVEGSGELEGLVAESNPIVVREGVERVLWGDLHGHSQHSDGTGTPDQYFRYARDVAGLDVSALTDHDHWGMVPLDGDRNAWRDILASGARHHEPERFVTLPGYEWTNWLHGHRHVLYFDTPDAEAEEQARIYSSLDPDYETPAQLWDALRGRSALTFAHHSAGGPVSTNWRDYPPDPVLEPVTEIVSVHGSSEALDSPRPIYDPVPGNFVRDVVNAGAVLGFIGSGDSHDGHPGLVQISDPNGSGGLAAIRSDALTRAGVLDALRDRRVYATDGARIWLDVHLDGRPMGSLIEGAAAAGDGEEAEGSTVPLTIEIAGTAPIERVDLIRSGHTASIAGDGSRDWRIERAIPPLRPGEYHYVRVVQEDGRTAWSSPIFARAASDG